MKRLLRALIVILPLIGVLAAASPAAAHPMGNFSINHFSALSVDGHIVRILYIVDMAEIPTFQELGSLNVDRAAQLSGAARSRYLASKARDLASGLTLSAGGRQVTLRIQATDLLFPPGAGGLPTERVYLVLDGSVPAGSGRLQYRDGNFQGRAGWKEIVVQSVSGTRLNSTAPRNSVSKALTVYPTSVSSSPPQNVTASISLSTSTALQAGVHLDMLAPATSIRNAEAPLFGAHGAWSQLARGLTRVGKNLGATSNSSGTGSTLWGLNRTDALTNLMNRPQLAVNLLLLSLFIAFWFGAAHALSPGHGKTMVAAYLVGSRGTGYHALVLGLTVTVTHTAGVFALGFITLYLSHYILPDQLYPWLGFVSGLLVAAMGVGLFTRRLSALRRRGGRDRAHIEPVEAARFADAHSTNHEHPHVHAHAHGFEHRHEVAGTVHRHGPFGTSHAHAPTPSQAGDEVSLKSLIALGVSGGILPCPSALVVLLSAIAFHRVAFGMVLIVAFSAGLATTLTGIGMLMVYGRRFVARIGSRHAGDRLAPAARAAVRILPIFSAGVVAAIGAVLAIGALGPGLVPVL
ncbi:MAG TPA: sulfite exporter TauE/SafE family protein [Chloroflexota bacterium]